MILILFGCSTSDGLARKWTVNPAGTGDAPSIQAAIDSALSGDSVFLEPGTYYESINFHGKSLPVSGSGRFSTIIDASRSDGPCATFITRETNAAVLEHMTLNGGKGYGAGDARMGGGVYIDGAEPVLRNLLITGNGAAELLFGGGVQVFGKRIEVHPIIEYCEIRNNKAARDGGGLGFMGYVIPTIRHCNIHDNEAQSGDGGGVWCITTLGAIIEDNVIIDNKAGDKGGGINISTNSEPFAPKVEIANNLIANNIAYGNDSFYFTGGGIMLDGNANIHHNTIVGNSGIHGGVGMVTGGIAMMYDGIRKIEYNIIANTVQGFGIGCQSGTTPEFNHNIAWNNPGGTLCPEWASGTDNVEVDPLFCNPSDDNFTVQETSPALTRFSSYAGYDPTPGCKGKIVYSTWGAIKARHY